MASALPSGDDTGRRAWQTIIKKYLKGETPADFLDGRADTAGRFNSGPVHQRESAITAAGSWDPGMNTISVKLATGKDL